MGQKTGTSKTAKKVAANAIKTDFILASQALYSGSFLMNGLNSSLDLLGSDGPSASGSGTCRGVKKPKSKLRLYMANAYVTI